MISFKLQIILIMFSTVTFIFLINMIKKYVLELRYSLLWLLLSLLTITFSIFPGIPFVISQIMGTEKPVNALFFLGIIGSLSIIFSLTVSLSQLSNKVKEMAQEIGMLKEEIERNRFNNVELDKNKGIEDSKS